MKNPTLIQRIERELIQIQQTAERTQRYSNPISSVNHQNAII